MLLDPDGTCFGEHPQDAGAPPSPNGQAPPVVYDPGPLPVDAADGAALLDEVHAFLCAYVIFPSAAAAVAVTLWAAHTHLVGQFESTPRLALLSPEKQCGKSRVLGAAGAAVRRGGDPVGRLARLPVPADRRRAGHDPAR